MFSTIGLRTQGILIAGTALVMAFGAMRLEKAIFFNPAPAVVTSVSRDCYIQQHRVRFLEFLAKLGKESDDITYMRCDRARRIAKRKGYSSYAVKNRTRIAYRYVSPSDDYSYSGEFVLNIFRNANYARGDKITIYANKKIPEKSVYYFWTF